MRRQTELEKKRTEQLERENRRWEREEDKIRKNEEKEMVRNELNKLGIRKDSTSNSLAYNPINLSYNDNPRGLELKMKDEDTKVRRYVRAHNIDFRGDSKYNLLNGG